MHRYITLLLTCLFFQTAFGQAGNSGSTGSGTATTTPAAADNTIVNYSFSTNKMDVLPFDRPFTFHLTDLPTTSPLFNVVRIRIVKMNGHKQHQNDKKEIRQDDPENTGVTYVLDDWLRDGDAAVSSINIPEPFSLAPSAAYRVLIQLGKKKDLTTAQKDGVVAALKSSKGLDKAVNVLAQKTLADTAVKDAEFIKIYKADIIAQVRQAVQEINPEYNIKSPEALSRNTIASFRDALMRLKYQIKMFSALKSDPLKDAQKQLQAHLGDLSTTDWFTVGHADQMYKDISAVVEGTKAAKGTDSANAKKLLVKLDDIIAIDTKLVQELADSVVFPNLYGYSAIATTYSPNFATNSSFYINLDLGYAYVWRMDRGMAYTGFNFYFRPIDKTIPLSYYNTFWDVIATRTSLLLGVSIGSIQKANVRKGLIGTQALVVGGGFKLNPFLKINGGCFMNYRYDQNPLVTQNSYRFSMSPFVSLSLDLDVRPLLGGLFDSIFK